MKSIGNAFLVGVLLVWTPTASIADEVSKNAKIEEIMQLMHSDRMLNQVLDQMTNTLRTQLDKMDVPAEARQTQDEMQQKMMTLIADRLSWNKAKSAYISIYAETFTEGEIDGMLGFYKSSAGQAMLEKMPRLIQKSMAVAQQLMSDAMPEIQRMVEESKQKYKK
jgi:hypothetical protein